MSGPTVAEEVITIDLVNDLKDGSHLKTLLDENQRALFSITSELAQFATQPIESFIGLKPTQIKLQAPATWKTSTGVGFSLSPAASCTFSVSDTSTKYAIAKTIGSNETQEIFAGPTPGKVYVNLELDCEIKGNISASGTVMAVGIAGKASGSGVATLGFSHAVPVGITAAQALRGALSSLVFPFEPDCAHAMAVGDIGKVNFDASLNCELDITYSFGTFKFSAPGIDSARQSLRVGFDRFTLPSLDIESGVKGTLTYVHSDHFGAIISRPDNQYARLYLVRSAANEIGASIGIAVGLSTCDNLNATVDKNQLTQAVNNITRGGGDKVAEVADALQSSLLARANQWLSGQKGDLGCMAQLSRQNNRALLFTFTADLSKADLAKESWKQFSHGDLKQAARIGGMTLLPGSGISKEFKGSVSIGLHFFNLFKFVDSSTYFRNSRVEIGPHGSIRFLHDIGKEHETDIKNAMEKSRMHFVATATGNSANKVADAEVDLYLELSEKEERDEANRIVDSIGSLPPSPDAQAAQVAMRQFVAANKGGALNLVAVLKPSAYNRLTCSHSAGLDRGLPPALPQEEDRQNWNAFRQASDALLELWFVSRLTYSDWQQFNLSCNGKTSGVPDRRHRGNTTAVPSNFFGSLQNVKEHVKYFYVSSAQFMNLCEDLHALAGTVGHVNTDKQWDDLVARLASLVNDDVNNDWSKPAMRALLQLCCGTVKSNLEPGEKRLTCTITVS